MLRKSLTRWECATEDARRMLLEDPNHRYVSTLSSRCDEVVDVSVGAVCLSYGLYSVRFNTTGFGGLDLLV